MISREDIRKMYSIPALKSKYPNLVEKLNLFLTTSDFSTFDLTLLKKEAKEIKENVDLAGGFALLGMISCLEKDEKNVRSFFERAIQQSGGELSHIINFAVSLKNLCFFEEAYGYASDAHEQHPLNLECIDFAIEMACALNKKVDFIKLTTERRKITKEAHPLEFIPRYTRTDEKECSDFIRKNSEPNHVLPPGHIDPLRVFKECGPELVRTFGAPLNVVTEVMLDSDHKPNLVAWVQWFGGMDHGMELYDQFEQWYIEHDYDMKTDIVSFNIEFVGN